MIGNYGCPLFMVCLLSFYAGDMPISLEQWRAAVGRWVAHIQRTLVIRRGVNRAPSSHGSSASLLGQSHNGEKKLMVKRKGRKKHKDHSHGGSAMTNEEFYDSLILPAAQTCHGRNLSKDVSDRNLVARLKELFGFAGLGAVVAVIMILLLRSGDVEANPGPVERGRWLYFGQFTLVMTETIFITQ